MSESVLERDTVGAAGNARDKRPAQRLCIKQAQTILDDKVSDDKQRLGVQMNEDGILVCKGWLQGQYPGQSSLHHYVSVPKLRQFVKKTVKECHGCRRFHAKPVSKPPPGNLPVDRTEGDRPFQVVGVDFAMKYRVTRKTERKAYITLYACSLLFIPSTYASQLVPGSIPNEFSVLQMYPCPTLVCATAHATRKSS
jgi:hypothetical protein